jgi:hypothetical protein
MIGYRESPNRASATCAASGLLPFSDVDCRYDQGGLWRHRIKWGLSVCANDFQTHRLLKIQINPTEQRPP